MKFERANCIHASEDIRMGTYISDYFATNVVLGHSCPSLVQIVQYSHVYIITQFQSARSMALNVMMTVSDILIFMYTSIHKLNKDITYIYHLQIVPHLKSMLA